MRGERVAHALVRAFPHGDELCVYCRSPVAYVMAVRANWTAAPHWLSGFSALVTSAQQVNVSGVLLPRAEQCRDERGQIPNFVAVNFITIGDVLTVVDELNGVA